MKTLEEIKDQYAQRHGYKNFRDLAPNRAIFESALNEIAEDFANAKAKALLEEAAEKAMIRTVTLGQDDLAQVAPKMYHKPSGTEVSVDKHSILSLQIKQQ